MRLVVANCDVCGTKKIPCVDYSSGSVKHCQCKNCSPDYTKLAVYKRSVKE